MASDTATLDLQRIQQEHRRMEAERDGTSARVLLGPDDRAPDGEGPVETDPATRAHEIVQEVLAAASGDTGDVPVAAQAPSSPAAATARRIVEEVLEAATEADHERSADEDETTAPASQKPAARSEPVRADLVLLGLPEPLVLLPGRTYEPGDGPYRPASSRSLERLVARLVDSLGEGSSDRLADRRARMRRTGAEAREVVSDAVREAAGESPVPGTRWAVALTVWALAFALVVPLALRGVLSSVDLTVNLWDDAAVEQPADEVATR